MALPGLLVEYFINGSCALVWLLVLAFRPPGPGALPEKEWAILAIPVLYVLGMAVDFIALLVSKPIGYVAKTLGARPKDKCEEREYRRLLRGCKGSVFVMYHSEQLGREYVMRSSRDRIARGAIVNIGAATVVLATSAGNFPGTILNGAGAAWILLVGAALLALAISMWLRFERLTSRFKREAVKAIRQAQEPSRSDLPQALRDVGKIEV